MRRVVLEDKTPFMPLQAVPRYRDLLQVEELFRTAKALMRTRTVYHSSDEAIRGHVFCSFLALVLRKELQSRCEQAGIKPEWAELLRCLDKLQLGVVAKAGKEITVRTPVTGPVGPVFRAAGVALPPIIAEATSV